MAPEPFMEDGDFFGEPTRSFLGVGELGAQALLGDQRTGREPPGSFGSGLALAVSSCGDP